MALVAVPICLLVLTALAHRASRWLVPMRGKRARWIGFALSLAVVWAAATFVGIATESFGSGGLSRPALIAPLITLAVLGPIWYRLMLGHEMVHEALDALDQGISIVDRQLRLVAWNARYLEIFGFAADEVEVGQSLESLLAQGEARSGIDAIERAAFALSRVGATRRREPQQLEQSWPDGVVLRIVGYPLSGGEYLTSFSDISQIRAATRALSRMNEELEQRVTERTQELTAANAALAAANATAARVTNAQNRFVAAASHDLLQPLHAARLFVAAARGTLSARSKSHPLLEQADVSIETADRLLRALLNLSRIEVGGISPELTAVDLDALLVVLRREFRPVAEQKGLALRIFATQAWAHTNADLLRSVLQNLVGNAIRYTDSGTVAVCVRRSEPEAWRIEVRDSGEGIPEDVQELIFREFTRLADGEAAPAGTGLGLAIAERVCGALGHRLALRSQSGRGSVFTVTLGRAVPSNSVTRRQAEAVATEGLRVLCAEDQPDVLTAQSALLRQWGAAVVEARSFAEAQQCDGQFDLLIADYHLGGRETGLDLIEAMRPRTLACALVTANASDGLKERAAALGVTLLRKPVPPPALRSLMIHATHQRRKLAADDVSTEGTGVVAEQDKGLGTVRDAQLAKGGGHMRLHRIFRNPELIGDLFVYQPPLQAREDPELGGGERRPRKRGDG